MIEVNHLSVAWTRHAALRNVNLTISCGSLCVVTGSSGSGKSTLLRALRGGVEPTGGQVKIEGLAVQHWPAKALSLRVAHLCQSAEVNYRLNVTEVASLHATVNSRLCLRHSTAQAVRKALEMLGVAHLADRLYGTLSHGEQRRVQLARVLARVLPSGEERAHYLFLDEPGLGLTGTQWRHLLHTLRVLAASGITIVAAIGDIHLARTVSPKGLIVLRDGAVTRQVNGDGNTRPKGKMIS